ncbi:RES family NAD+ phosphorylase [Ectothiorhodospira shaposhnikovii]
MPPEADLLAQFSEVEVHWPKSYRIVPSRFPPIDLFEGVAGQAGDLAALHELEGLTSNRLREAAGEIHLVPEQDRRFGPGYTPVMAAFTYPAQSRFSDGGYGVYYCARDEHTAVAETRHHRERFLRESSEPSINLEMRVYLAELRAPLLDLCAPTGTPYLDPHDWRPSQHLGLQARQAGRYGFIYPSVRDAEGGLCAGVLRPPALGPTRQGRHLQYRWDGERITDIIELRATGY